MLGWELPPTNSGGLGTASLGLTQGLSPLDIDIDFVLPEIHGSLPFDHMRVHSATKYTRDGELESWENSLYSRSLGYGNYAVTTVDGTAVRATAEMPLPADTLPTPFGQAMWYAKRAARIASTHQFDIIHTHDWMTYQAGIAARSVASRRGDSAPFVAHVHATEVDRGGSHGNPAISLLEKQGLQAADRVVAVSHYTKQTVHREYDVPLSNISVVHNGINTSVPIPSFPLHALKRHHKLVLFMGRITMQKGPEYFLELARRVTTVDPSVRFLMVGSGDLEKACIERSAAMGLTGRVLFSSFLRGQDVNRAYQMADLFVMPSVSEPFGLVALEAFQNGTPVIASKQSGVAEVSQNLVTVDFWDMEVMTKTVLNLLANPHQGAELVAAGKRDLHHLSWDRAAAQVVEIYHSLLPSSPSFSPAT